MDLPVPLDLALHPLAAFEVPGVMSVRIEGREPLPREGPLLLVANRVSMLDPWLLTLAAGRPVQMGARSPLFWLPGFDAVASRLTAMPLLEGDKLGYAEALERGRAVVMFVDYTREHRPGGARFAMPPAFLEVLLATRSDRIPVVPLLIGGSGSHVALDRHPLAGPILAAGAAVFDPSWPRELYGENVLRVGRANHWRDTQGEELTLQAFRERIEDDLATLITAAVGST